VEASVATRPTADRFRLRLRLPGQCSDERLVAAVRAGDRAAFEAIYDRYHRMLLSFCRHMLGSRDEGEDAVQQTFLSAYRSLTDSSQPIALRAWLFAIARNQCLTQIGRRRERPAGEELEIATEELRQRLATVRHPEPIYKQGALAKYARLVSSASQGAVTSL